MAIKPNSVYKYDWLGLVINEKIIPDNAKWTNAESIKTTNRNTGDNIKVGDPYKSGRKLSNGTGKVEYVTLHNTEDIGNISDDAAQYALATEYQNMGWTRVHFYVDDRSIWQNLKAGLGLCTADPVGSAEVSFHAGDGNGTIPGSGNNVSLSVELVMNENPTTDAKARDNAARLCALLLYMHKLDISRLVTHTYWVNRSAGKTFADVDKQCTNMIKGKKWCPCYIFNSNNTATALKNWKSFKTLVQTYLDTLNKGNKTDQSATKPAPSNAGDELYRVQVGAFKVKSNATAYLKTVQKAGFTNAFIQEDKTTAGNIYRVQVGAYRVRANADNYLATVKKSFPDAYIVTVKATTAVNSVKLKTNAEIAKEVILGKWGAGEDRVNKLKAAGYDPKAVQTEVNKLLK